MIIRVINRKRRDRNCLFIYWGVLGIVVEIGGRREIVRMLLLCILFIWVRSGEYYCLFFYNRILYIKKFFKF